MLKSFVVAFSTYSKIPMPKIEWDEKSMKYSMCFFPFVGVVIGILAMGSYQVCRWMELSGLLRGVILTAIPILLTGGIHMDGFMDTIDAKSSYRSKEERLEILKDPHAGAFAIIYGCLYLLCSVSIFAELEGVQIAFVAWGYVYSRILSGLSVVTFQKAKKTGMLSETANNSAKSVRWILLVELLVLIGILFIGSCFYGEYIKDTAIFWYSVVVMVAGLLTFLYYGYTARKWFGGITGDLAGYFLQICELFIIVGVMVTGKLIA